MPKISALELLRLNTMSSCEMRLKREGFFQIAGVDEAGRGPIAGPVVAAACILPFGALFEHLNDSKLLTPKMREALFDKITNHPGVHFGIGIIAPATIDRVNILQATFLAMQKAVGKLPVAADYLLIDGNQLPYFEIPSESVVQGDSRSISIAAASVIAKVTRDRIMQELDGKYPEYGFRKHKGYGTELHRKAIRSFGLCPIHRKSFRNSRE
jgi:ribonuclease HII